MLFSIDNRQKSIKVDLNRLRKSLQRVLKELHCENKEIALILVDDNEIRKINADYLHRDHATNVLSFSMKEGEFGTVNPQIIGDIVISVETASRDAVTGKLDLMDEIEFLLIHGLLHLMGYNHEDTTPEQAQEMMAREHELFFLLRRYHLE